MDQSLAGHRLLPFICGYEIRNKSCNCGSHLTFTISEGFPTNAPTKPNKEQKYLFQGLMLGNTNVYKYAVICEACYM